MKKHIVVFEPSGLRIFVDEQNTFLQATRIVGLHLSSDCGGAGTCGKCSLVLQPAPEPTLKDETSISSDDLARGVRLACQHKVTADTRVVLTKQRDEVQILAEGISRQEDWILDSGGEGRYGIAIDLGTTTIVAYLLALDSGVQMSQLASLNPQVVFGEDVISRITHAIREKNGQVELSKRVTTEIDSMLGSLIEGSGIDIENLIRMAIVGNTAMHHLLLRADVKSLGVTPYEPSIRDALVTSGSEVGLVSAPNIEVFLPPNIAGFVGGDTVGFILSQRLDLSDQIVIGIDIGTNGEIVLSNRGELSCCSAAAGSAFEGATIQNGMRGKNGAIEYVSIKNPDDPPEISVIGDDPPQGICGSGIVDVTAEMLHAGILDSGGRLHDESRRVIENDEGVVRYLITNMEESGAERNIVFTQKDVRQVQLAKGAIHAGSTILLNESGLDVHDIDVVMLAGAFGSYIRPKSALTIGLFPQVGVDKVIQVGNAAGEGAKTLLLSSQSREFVEHLVPMINYLELANHDDFQSIFMESLKFPE
ncbi:MAG: ASKHA domain-containing protein [Candidatus Thorarchaeota archaeon]